jgi:TPR repeat protein
MFARGEGGEACFASAVWFLSRAADEHGLEEAELELGYVYQRRGEIEQAQQWFQRAAEHGSREAAQQLE